MIRKNRRHHDRIDHRIECRWVEGGTARAYIANISRGGCFVETRATPALRTPVTIELTPAEGETISLRGIVVGAHAGVGFAMQFDEPEPAVLERLEHVFMRAEASS